MSLATSPPPPRTRLSLLRSASQLLSGPGSLDEVVGPLLRLLAEEAGLLRSALTRYDADQELLVVVAAHGLTPAEVRRGRFKPGEGLTGTVFATGAPMAVPTAANDPLFLDRTGVGRMSASHSFVCVPVTRGGRVLGTLSGYRPSAGRAVLSQDVDMLSSVATSLAPHLEGGGDVGRDGVIARGSERAPIRPRGLIGRSKALQEVMAQLGQVAPTQTTVLLLGESGTGKELAAEALHTHGPRANGPFVKVNCAALPEGLVESELFGHERGAFTGAVGRRLGRFERAQGGTLFLDEVGELSPPVQVKLLRVIQEREFERVGGEQPLQADVRLVTATSRNLLEMVEEGTFRQDLYYRLHVFPIHLPPLRKRGEDVLLLADHFVELCSRAHGRRVRRISTSAIDMLMAYHWPGNVRELENCIERAVLLARDDVIQGHHLPPTLQTAEASGTALAEGLKERLAAVEREILLDTLKSTRGNMAEAARRLEVSERIMGLRVERYGIDLRRFRLGSREA